MSAKKLAFLHALSPLHAGTGQGIGSIDLPLARERATNLPIVPGSTVKGCLRDELSRKLAASELLALFGPAQGEDASKYAGAIRMGDARLLLLPVRALVGTFVWVSCPFILRRFAREAKDCGVPGDAPAVPTVAAQTCQAPATLGLALGGASKLVLEEFDFEIKGDSKAWADWLAGRLFGAASDWNAEFCAHFAIVDDDSFFFLAEFATEVTAHIAIEKDTGTVKSGALWYQEALPAESVLYLPISVDASRYEAVKADAAAMLAKVPMRTSMQVGGKASTGLGITDLILA